MIGLILNNRNDGLLHLLGVKWDCYWGDQHGESCMYLCMLVRINCACSVFRQGLLSCSYYQ